MISIKKVLTPLAIAFFVSMLAFGFAAPVIAGDMDMSDNSVCMDCHGKHSVHQGGEGDFKQ